MDRLIMCVFSSRTRTGRFTLTCFAPGYSQEFRSLPRGTAYRTTVRVYGRKLKASCQRVHGGGAQPERLAWATWWTFNRFRAHMKHYDTLPNILQRTFRALPFATSARWQPPYLSAGQRAGGMVDGRARRACFAKACRKAGICTMQIDGCSFPLSTGKAT